MNPALVQRLDNRFLPALVRAGLGVLSRAQGERTKSHGPCACTSRSQSSAQIPWAFLSVGPTGECSSGGRCGGDCCGGGGCGGEPQYKRATTKAMPGADKCPPFTRFPRPKDPPRKPEHPKHPTKPKSPVSTKPPAPEPPRTFPTPPFGGWGCFTPAIENPTLGPHSFEAEEWESEQTVRLGGREWRVYGFCARPTDVVGAMPIVLMMHQSGTVADKHRGYSDLQRLLASHGIASVSASDNGVDITGFEHAGLEFEDEAARATLCLRLAERYTAARRIRFGPRLGLLGHSKGGWAAQNLATLVNRGSDNLIGLADDSGSFEGCRVESVCLVGSSSHHADAPSCPILLIQGSRDEDLLLVPSWNLAGRNPAGFISVAYVPRANHNWFNRTFADRALRGGRTGPNSAPILTGPEHERILTGLAGSLFLSTLADYRSTLMNGTSVLPHRSATPDYQIAYRTSDCVALLREFGMSSLNRGRKLRVKSLARGATHKDDVEVSAAVFSGLTADTEEWPRDVPVYVPPGEHLAAMMCCGHGLVLRRLSGEEGPPQGAGSGIRFPLPAGVMDLSQWMIAVTAAAVDPNPIYTPDGAPLVPSFVGGRFCVGVEYQGMDFDQQSVRWSSPRRLVANDDLQGERASRAGEPVVGSRGFQERFCEGKNEGMLRHIPYFCSPLTPNSRNNGTTAFATTYWFSADCFPTTEKDDQGAAVAIWLVPTPEAAVAVQRVDLIRRARVMDV